MRTLKASPDVRALIRRLHPLLKKKVRVALVRILESPESGKPLRDELRGLYSFPVGKWRIIYGSFSHIIEIVAIGPREVIYQETLRLIRREEKK